MKSLMLPEERAFADALMRLVTCNHFLPERIELEREALGADFVNDSSAAWNLNFASEGRSQNIVRLCERTAATVGSIQQRLRNGGRMTRDELPAYETLVGYHLYQQHRDRFRSLTRGTMPASEAPKLYETFARDMKGFLEPARKAALSSHEIALHFAGVWQLQRAFTNIFTNIIGSSPSIARLRASVWESIFTCDFNRYRQGLFERMHEITTLITGPSGTGKELVARAVACSGFIPFDVEKQRFAHDPRELFFPLNLSALSSNLIESELFGHRRGAFTGALQEHAGWLEVCPTGGSVFLDEIGEIDGALQVKLLRVLQTRVFNRLGESRPRTFLGKIIAATNQELALDMQVGRFREDFYYRICSDVIATPSLRDQLAESPEDLGRWARFIACQLVSEGQAEELSQEVVQFVDQHLGQAYGWPGNFRELEQCVRNVLVRRRYEPMQMKPAQPAFALVADLEAGRLTADELLRRYCALVYSQTQSIEQTARRLDLDRRTVKAKLNASAGWGNDL